MLARRSVGAARVRFGTAVVVLGVLSWQPASAALLDVTQPLLQLAQTDTEAADLPPVSSVPDSFTATFGDWLLRCQRAADPTVTIKTCDVTTMVVAEGQTQPFAQISVTKGADAIFHMTAVVPVNITVGLAPLLATDEADAGTTMPWIACTPGGCIADLALSDADLQRYRAHTKTGRLVFTDSGGNQIQVNFSFRGLAQALDAMALEQIGK